MSHQPSVAIITTDTHGYPYLPACSCGWRFDHQYASKESALVIAEVHADHAPTAL